MFALRIRHFAEQSYVTKSGDKLQFTVKERSETLNMGFTVDLFEVFIDKKAVGYLKAKYIRSSDWQQKFPDLKSFGKECFPRVFESLLYAELQNKNPDLNPHLELNYWADRIKDLNKNLSREYKKWKSYYMDHPVIDYIRVTDENLKRQGIGTALYEYAARWYGSRDMKLYASSNQSDSAQATWENLSQTHPVKEEKNPMNTSRDTWTPKLRRFLDYTDQS